jgi:hypothetical protein
MRGGDIFPETRGVSTTLNSRPSLQDKLSIEQLHLRLLSMIHFTDYDALVVRVCSIKTIELHCINFSFFAPLIGDHLTVHLRNYRLDLFLCSQFVETFPRLYQRKG